MKFAALALCLVLLACDSEVKQARANLSSTDPVLRAEACRVLGEHKDKVSAPKVIELLKDEDTDVRKQAARALGNFEDLAAVEPLAAFYAQEQVEDVADAGVKSLIALGDSSVQPLLGLARAGRVWVRAGAARALGKLKARAAVDQLIWMLDDREPDVRIAAVHALREIGDERGTEALARAVEDEDPDVEGAAEKALSGEGYEEQLDKAKRLARLRY